MVQKRLKVTEVRIAEPSSGSSRLIIGITERRERKYTQSNVLISYNTKRQRLYMRNIKSNIFWREAQMQSDCLAKKCLCVCVCVCVRAGGGGEGLKLTQ